LVWAIAGMKLVSPAHLGTTCWCRWAAMQAIRTVSGAHGFNIGMNQGEIAGAGIAAHLHQHVVPRWAGDTNFMPAIAHTKVLPQLLPDTRALLAKSWP
jgi:ATP adenylyltransferase